LTKDSVHIPKLCLDYSLHQKKSYICEGKEKEEGEEEKEESLKELAFP
jgi:hypothetical protein